MVSNTSTNKFAEFIPRDYLEEYYSEVGDENLFLLRFFVKAYENMQSTPGRLLELGGGPTIYQLITAAKHVGEIHFTDYVQANLDEVDKWLNDIDGAFDWDKFIAIALELENGQLPSREDIDSRKKDIKQKVSKLFICDAFSPNPIAPVQDTYDIVSTNFVAESITSTKEEWASVTQNIASRVSPGGVLLMAGLSEATYWLSGNKKFPAAYVETKDVTNLLGGLGFEIELLEAIPSQHGEASDDFQGYKGMFCIKAVRAKQ